MTRAVCLQIFGYFYHAHKLGINSVTQLIETRSQVTASFQIIGDFESYVKHPLSFVKLLNLLST